MEIKTITPSFNVSELIDERFGKKGTATRIEAEKKAYAFYIGQVIAEARKLRKLSQSELAYLTGHSRSFISRIENGQINPKYSKFHRIINTLGMQLDYVKRQ